MRYIPMDIVITAHYGLLKKKENSNLFIPASGIHSYCSRTGLTQHLAWIEDGAIPAVRQDSVFYYIRSLITSEKPIDFIIFNTNLHGAQLTEGDSHIYQYIKAKDLLQYIDLWEQFRQSGKLPHKYNSQEFHLAKSFTRNFSKIGNYLTWGESIFYLPKRIDQNAILYKDCNKIRIEYQHLGGNFCLIETYSSTFKIELNTKIETVLYQNDYFTITDKKIYYSGKIINFGEPFKTDVGLYIDNDDLIHLAYSDNNNSPKHIILKADSVGNFVIANKNIYFDSNYFYIDGFSPIYYANESCICLKYIKGLCNFNLVKNIPPELFTVKFYPDPYNIDYYLLIDDIKDLDLNSYDDCTISVQPT